MATNTEGGIRRNSAYFAREETDDFGNPITPADPEFLLYSSVVRTMSGAASAEYEERTGVGNYAPTDKNRQQETAEISVEYDVERFFVDANGDPQGAFADAVQRTVDHNVASTHSYLEVEEKASVVPANTWNHRYYEDNGNSHPSGTTPDSVSRATRIEGYARGCVPSEATLTIDPSDSAVLSVELSYTAHKYRRYQIDQPDGEYVGVRSTESVDAGDVVIESTDGSESETLTLDGTTTVFSSTTFGSLRVHLPDDQAGDVEVFASSDGTAADQLLTVIRGADAYDGIEGDTGVPAIGAGGFDDGADLGSGIASLGAGMTFSGHPGAENIDSTAITVSNEVEQQPTDDGLAQAVMAANQTVSAEVTVFGETESPEKFDQHLMGTEAPLRWSVNGGDVEIPRAYCSSGGETEKEQESAVMQVDVEYTGMEPSDGGDLLQFIPA